MLWIAVALVAAAAVLGGLALTLRIRRRPDDVARFLRARAITTDWARHPSPAPPAPVAADRERR